MIFFDHKHRHRVTNKDKPTERRTDGGTYTTYLLGHEYILPHSQEATNDQNDFEKDKHRHKETNKDKPGFGQNVNLRLRKTDTSIWYLVSR